MRTFLTIAMLTSLAFTFAGTVSIAILLPWWAVPLIGLAAVPATICTLKGIGEVRKVGRDEAGLLDVTGLDLDEMPH